MNPNRTGKIACLPETVREELNRRLHDGDSGQSIMAWLNDLPAVRQILKTCFHGKAINATNLSQWRNGGYRDWRLEHEPKPPPRPEWLSRQRQWQPQPCQQQQSQAASKPPAPEAPPQRETPMDSQQNLDPAEISDRLAIQLGLELTQFANTWLAEARNPRERWRRLRELLAALAQLRRGDHRAASLDLAQDRWEAEVTRRETAQEQQDIKEYKDAVLNPVRAARRLPYMAEICGGGEAGWRLAARNLEVELDLAPGTLLKPGCEPWQEDWTPGEKPNEKACFHKRKKRTRTQKPKARRRRPKTIPDEPQGNQTSPDDPPDSNQNTHDSTPIQSDPGDFESGLNQI